MADYTLSAKLIGDSTALEKAFATAEKAVENFAKKIEGVSKKLESLSKAFKPVSAAASAAGIASIKIFSDFEAKMSNVGAISGAAGTDMEKLTQKAKEMGANTKFSASEAADALSYMAMAGWKTGDMLDGIEGIMNLAAASGEDLARTSDIVTDALTAFGLKASDSGHFADILASASSNSNTNVSLLGESFKYVAPLCGTLGYSAEDAAVALGLMANSGIKGSQSGTALKTALANLASPTKDMKEAMGALGLSLTDSEGNMKSLMELMGDMRGAFSELDTKQQAAYASTIFGKEAMSGMLAVINSSDEDFQKLTDAIYGCDGAAKNMAETMQDNLSGRITTMKSKLEGVAIVIGEKLEPYVSRLVQMVSNAADAFMTLDDRSQSVIIVIGAIAAALAPALLGLSKITSLVSKAVSMIGKLSGVLSFLCSPVGIVVAAIAGLAAVFVYLMKTNEDFRNKVISVWDSVSAKIQEVVGAIDFKGIFDGLIDQAKALAPTLCAVFEAVKMTVGLVADAFSAFFSGLTAGFGAGASGANGFSNILVSALGLISPPLKMVLMAFELFGPQITSLISMVGESLVPVFSTLGNVIGSVLTSALAALQGIMAALVPVIAQIVNTVLQLVSEILPVLVSLFNQLAPFIAQIAEVISQIAIALAPMIAQLVGSLLPVITNIVTVVMNVVEAVMPALIAILNLVMSAIQALVPVITNIISVVVSVVSSIISAVSPIISFIGTVISSIMAIISPIVTFVANTIATVIQVVGTVSGAVSGVFSTVFQIVSGVFSNISTFISGVINAVSSIISGLTNVVGGVFNSIYSIISSVMGNVRSFITGVFSGIQSAWSGLTSFVSGIFSGIGSAVQTLVNQVKGFVNGVIGGINAAVGVINLIPGVSIGSIPYLLHGSDDWAGGFARMNEGGRGELTYLPDGTQVIPHDISVKYAKEAAQANTANGYGTIDYDRIINGIADAMKNVRVQHISTLNGRTVAEETLPLVDRGLGGTAGKRARYAV